MKKVLIVNGSKRKNGNSYALEKYFAEKLAGKAPDGRMIRMA